MSNFLAQLFGAPVDSVAQLRQAQGRRFDPAAEARARANGFGSAEEMALWAAQRSKKRGGTVARPGSAGRAPAGLDTMMAIHPKNIFENILARWQGAMKN